MTMKRYALCAAVGLALAASPAWSNTNTYFGFTIGVGNAPPPPVVVYRERPHVYLEPETRVYVVEDSDDDDVNYDVFQFGGYWYACDDGYWYRAHSYRGPFRVVDVRYVPRPIFAVPAKHWHHRHPHGGPPGLTRRGGYVVVEDRDDHGHHHGHGHGHGHKHDD